MSTSVPDFNALARLKRAATQARTVADPRGSLSGGCWALVRQPSTGSAFGRLYGRYDNCRRAPRRGCLTCAQYAEREPDAQGEKRRAGEARS